MHAINYEAPSTLDQAVSLLRKHGEAARPLCGGTDLLIQMRAGVRRPEYLVDVKNIKELRQISFDAKKGLRLGAAVSCIEIHESDLMRKHYPGSDRGRASDRLAADSEPRVGRRQSVQRLAGRRHHARADRTGRERADRSAPRREREVPVETFIVAAPGAPCSRPASCWSSS